MTAVSAPARTKPDRSGLWTFLRLLGGWATVAALAYLLWMPSKDSGWPTMLFGWVLLTLLADEFAGWFGYIALALGILPLLHAETAPEQWFIILPLIGGALFALLIMKHSGGPFVLPFGALLFAGTIIGAAKFGVKIDPSLKLPASTTFQHMALLPMLVMVSFSFVRQLISKLLRWQAARRARAAAVAVTTTPAVTAPATSTVASSAPAKVDPAKPAPAAAQTVAAGPAQAAASAESERGVVAEPITAALTTPPTAAASKPPVAAPTAESAAASVSVPANPTMIDIDLSDIAGENPPKG
ncbi:hypothetical protein Dxin01_03079 [Deinococcus xinjiangensis]|uniref:Uncharacterized protein n=1 Tax=Deinococcus xinjiangensis TaxID=457454 RepID=A0ABP9VDK1_9DEIO